MKLYEVKALAHETQSRIRQDLNSWNDFLEHASRVYRYRFMDQILIYAQRPDAVACATMNIWNSKMGCWIKKGNRGIALIDESNSRKLKYVWDVASVVPKMGGHLPRLWIRKPYHTETIQNRLLKVYGLQPQTDKYDTIEHTMDYLVEYLADEYAADIAQEKYSSENSPLSELDEEKYKMDEYRRNVRVFFRYGLNRMIKEKMTLDTEVAKLKLLKANFKSQKYRLEDAINKEYPVRIAKLEEKIEGLRQDIITRGSGEILSDGFEIRINGVSYDDKKEGGAALIAAAKESKTPERTMIGEYKGFKLYSRFDAFFNLYYIHMQGRCEHTIEMSSDPAGMITRLNNCMAGFEKRLSDVQDALDETRIELETAEKEVTKKFDKEDILSEKLKRLSFLNAQLDADRKETPQNAPQNTQAQRNDIKEKYINI